MSSPCFLFWTRRYSFLPYQLALEYKKAIHIMYNDNRLFLLPFPPFRLIAFRQLFINRNAVTEDKPFATLIFLLSKIPSPF